MELVDEEDDKVNIKRCVYPGIGLLTFRVYKLQTGRSVIRGF